MADRLQKRPPASQVPAGQIEIADIGKDWLQVAIGRAKWTKRFNLSRAEAAELARVLADVLPEVRATLEQDARAR